VIVWDVETQQSVLSFPPAEWTKLTVILFGIGRVAWSPDGRQIATASGETAMVWDAATGDRRFTWHCGEGEVQNLTWSPDACSLLVRTQVGTLALLNLPRSQDALVLRGHTKAVRCASWSPNGRWIASGGYDNTARIWDAATATTFLTLRGHTD